MRNITKKIFKWRTLFYSLISAWFCSLVIFFVNPKQTQQWLTKTFEGEVNSLKETSTPVRFCEIQFTHAWRMNDNVLGHWKESKTNGLTNIPLRKSDIVRQFKKGNLVKFTSNEKYFIDTMYYSYAFARPFVKDFVDEMWNRFQYKLLQTDLYGTKLVLTSFTRTKSSVDRLRRKNRNAIKCSTHLHGTTFDISYHTFMFHRPLTEGEISHLKETLATVLFEMREEKKCFVKYEYFQTCFHVVCRDAKAS